MNKRKNVAELVKADKMLAEFQGLLPINSRYSSKIQNVRGVLNDLINEVNLDSKSTIDQIKLLEIVQLLKLVFDTLSWIKDLFISCFSYLTGKRVMNNLKQQVGKRIKMIRVAAGIKQKDLAVKLNITAPLLSMYEQGTREPSISFIQTFARYFSLNLSQFFSLVEDGPQVSNPEIALLIDNFKELISSIEKKALKSNHTSSC
ncbi:MAG: helix-turn-helix transcriptional regulator [Oryzomonas sp.]